MKKSDVKMEEAGEFHLLSCNDLNYLKELVRFLCLNFDAKVGHKMVGTAMVPTPVTMDSRKRLGKMMPKIDVMITHVKQIIARMDAEKEAGSL